MMAWIYPAVTFAVGPDTFTVNSNIICAIIFNILPFIHNVKISEFKVAQPSVPFSRHYLYEGY